MLVCLQWQVQGLLRQKLIDVERREIKSDKEVTWTGVRRKDMLFAYCLFTFNVGAFEEREEIWGHLSLMWKFSEIQEGNQVSKVSFNYKNVDFTLAYDRAIILNE